MQNKPSSYESHDAVTEMHDIAMATPPRRRYGVLVGIALGLLAFGVGSWWSSRRDRQGHPPLPQAPAASVEAVPPPSAPTGSVEPSPVAPPTAVAEPPPKNPQEHRRRRRKPRSRGAAIRVDDADPAPHGVNDAPILH